MKRIVALLFIVYSLTACAQTTLKKQPVPSTKKWQTSLNLYVLAKDLSTYLEKNSSAILVDIRTPEELGFTGWAPRTNIHVPFLQVDQSRSSWSKKKKTYGKMKNRFVDQMKIELKKLNVKKDQEIFMMCRSGSRSAKATKTMAKLGYTNVYTVLNGFEGQKRKDGNIGLRDINGWKNSGGKWSYKLDQNIVWFDDKYDN